MSAPLRRGLYRVPAGIGRRGNIGSLLKHVARGAGLATPCEVIHMPIATVNPATGQLIKSFEELSAAQIEQKLQNAADTFQTYRRTSFADRARMMIRAAEILETEKESFGRLMTTEMGKTIRSAREEAAKCAVGCRYYAETAERWLAAEPVQSNATRSYIHYQPIGPVLAVMPWNFPFWQVFRFAAPALMAGNVGLLKHASNVPQCALAIEEIFRRAGFPEGAFQTLLIGAGKVQRVIEDRRVVAVTLTGSEPAGRQVAGEAGKQIKKTVLELGGSDPFIVMPSANLTTAVATAVKARTINNGQSCIAAKRFIVADSIYDEFQRRFVEGMAALRVGDPMAEDTDVGPVVNEQSVHELETQVDALVKEGAKVVSGGKRLERQGYFFAPTVVVDVPIGSRPFYEEIFGPVAMLFRVRDAAEAVRVANDSPFGLGASAWTNDESERKRFVDEIEAGLVFINSMVVSDPRLPFGGVKNSGYGRELSGYGIREFTNIKTVCINE
jgi:succinate-semialdehyde dehydrogenase / glutarate-semialdehyde dehydrogenase